MAKFSERFGLAKPITPQINSIDLRLKTRLWNAVDVYLAFLFQDNRYHDLEEQIRSALWTEFLAFPFNRFPRFNGSRLSHQVRADSMTVFEKFFFSEETEWHRLYEFIEFIAAVKVDEKNARAFARDLNLGLEGENAGYRFSNGIFQSITNEVELQSVADSASRPEPAMAPVTELMKKAIGLFAKKPKPDYGNTIKEALSALESLCKHVCGDPNQKTLTPALEKATKELGLPETMRDGFKAIYKYACDNGNIRHGNIDVSQATEEEARYLLVTISAAVNFIADKARQLGKL